jgi:hypothetical protein
MTAPTGMSVTGSPITGSGTLALSITSPRRFQQVLTSVAGALAATPDQGGQLITGWDGTDGSLGMAYGTGSGSVFNWINYYGATDRFEILKNLTMGNRDILSVRRFTANSTTTSHELRASGSTYIDNAIDVQNTTDDGAGNKGYSAVALWHPSDTIGTGRASTFGLGPNVATEYGNKAYYATNPPAASPTDAPPDIGIYQEQNSGGGGYRPHARILFDGTNQRTRIYGWGNAVEQSASYVQVDAAGLLTANSGLTVSSGTVTLGSGSGLAKLTSGSVGTATAGTDYVSPALANGICNGRLTLTSGTPVLTTTVSAAGTVYFTPYKGNSIALYTGSAWKTMNFSELSITLSSLSASTAYDVFAYDNSGVVALETVAWTNATTRATALTTQDGVMVKSGATTRRYLGSFILDGSKTCSVTFGTAAAGGGAAQIDIWNNNNRVSLTTTVLDSTDSWTYTTATWRSADNSNTNRATIFTGLSEDVVTARALAVSSQSTTATRYTGIGLDSTSSPASGQLQGAARSATVCEGGAFWAGFPGVGQHYLQWLEKSDATGTSTWSGDGGGIYQSGLAVTLLY